MRLSELEPQFERYEYRIESYNVVDGDQSTWRERGCPTIAIVGPREHRIDVDTLAEAQGIRFLCPLCFKKNCGVVGTHGVDVSFSGRGVPDGAGSHNAAGLPSRWGVTGASFEDLTMTPSILTSGCGWHGFVNNGEISII